MAANVVKLVSLEVSSRRGRQRDSGSGCRGTYETLRRDISRGKATRLLVGINDHPRWTILSHSQSSLFDILSER